MGDKWSASRGTKGNEREGKATVLVQGEARTIEGAEMVGVVEEDYQHEANGSSNLTFICEEEKDVDANFAE